MRALLIFLSSIFLLSGCSLFSPVQYDAVNRYMLTTVPVNVPHKRPSTVSLAVAVPEALPMYNTTRMAYSEQAYQINYFAKNAWSTSPAQMLQPLLVQTLQKTRHFKVVGQMPVMGQYDYVLTSQILNLTQYFAPMRPSMICFTLRVQLINVNNGHIVATKQFSMVQIAPENTPYGGVIAANIAVKNVLIEVAHFCLQHL